MELLNVITARSTWLLDMRDLNPRGRDLGSHIIFWLLNNYHFTKYPTSFSERENGALVFTQGSFQIAENLSVNIDLKIYDDGLVAETRSSTEDADLFLAITLELAASDLSGFGMVYNPKMVIRKIYFSELNVRCDFTTGHLFKV